MEIKELINLVQEKQITLSQIEKQIEELKAQASVIQSEIDENKSELLKQMKESSTNEVFEENLVATIFAKENISYTSDADVLSYLKQHNLTNLINTKITESLKKNDLKKAIKTDASLAEALNSMTIKSLTEYVVVTTKENHTLMLEHINNK